MNSHKTGHLAPLYDDSIIVNFLCITSYPQLTKYNNVNYHALHGRILLLSVYI